MTEKNMPKAKFKVGSVEATVWENKIEDGKVFQSVNILRNYKDKNGEWQKTNTFRINDIPKLRLVCDKTYEHLTMKIEDD